MRIDRLHVENFIGIRSVDLPLNGIVTAVFGPNGSGKSSLCDAVSFMATGQPRRTKLHKKDLGDLLHPGQKRGQASLQIDGVTYSRGIPTGNFSTASYDPQKGWEYLLDPGAFLRLPLDDRCCELFRLLGVSANAQSVQVKLTERKYPEEVINEIMPFLRAKET